MTDSDAPLRQWAVPGVDGNGTTDLAAYAGRTIVAVGPNGAGKSALSHWLATNGEGSAPVTRVLAHRRLWLQSAGSEMGANQRERLESNIAFWDSQAASRVRLEGDSERSSKLLYDLMAKVNGYNARFVALQKEKQDTSDAGESPLDGIARIFEVANLDITFEVTDKATFDARRAGDVVYPIHEMSDGEKAALLLAAQVVLSSPDGVLIVDEPERHLHRSISADFVTALMAERPNCAFVLLTHDLELVSRLEPSTTTVYIVSRMSWNENQPAGWALKVNPESADVPEQVRHAIFGGRDQLLFVEGESSSLDYPLYRILFPDWTVVPCGGSEEVVRAVAGLKEAGAYHWVDGRGALDGDARTAQEIAGLADKQVLVLPVNEVENLYYLKCIVHAVANQQATAMGKSATDLTAAAESGAIATLKANSIQHLASANAEKILRRQVFASLPSRQELAAAGVSVPLNLESPYPSEYRHLNDCIATRNYDEIVRRFSVRDSGLLKAVAEALGFQNRADYESAVRVRLSNDAELLARLQRIVGQLPCHDRR